MTRRLLVVCVLVALLSVAAFADKEGGAISLTGQNFFETVSNGRWFVEFYAPWCGHCKRLAPIWDDLHRQYDDGNIAKVNCDEAHALCSYFGVRGFPTLILLQGGKQYRYAGARNYESLEDFLDGDYTKVEATNIPPATVLDDNLTDFQAALFEISQWAKDHYMVAGAVTVLFAGSILFCVVMMALIFMTPDAPQAAEKTD